MRLVRSPLKQVPGVVKGAGEVMQHDTHIAIPCILRLAPLYFVSRVHRPYATGTVPHVQYWVQEITRMRTPATRRAGVRVLIISDPIRLIVRLGNRQEHVVVLAEARKGRWVPATRD